MNISPEPAFAAEPAFLAELKLKTQTGELPVPALPATLSKKKASIFLREGFARSVSVHGFVIFLFVAATAVRWMGFSSNEDEAKRLAMLSQQAIRVDIVDLPRMKMDELQKVDLTEEVKKEAEPQAPPLPPPPSKTAMVDPTPKPKAPDKKPEKPAEKVTKQVERIRERMRAEMKRRELMAKLKSKQKENQAGRELVAGNQVSEGFSLKGDIATERDAYNGRARAHLNRNWKVPGWMNAGKLSAVVEIKIGPDGRVVSHKFMRASGNADFDLYIVRAIEASDPFPVPPEALTRLYLEEGTVWQFPK